MLILFDQGTPLPLRRFLRGHTVRTAEQQGWDRLRNGVLLAMAEQAGFDVLLTTDRNIFHQQNLVMHKIAIVVIGFSQWPALRPHAELISRAVDQATAGTYVEVTIPK